jgi:glycosyltransferase involved in cell wall biosynthesis
MPSVSFIIPSHNRAGELPQTLDSLLAQTSGDWEVVLIDDHSTDGALDVARAYAARDERFRVVQLPDPKRGASTARNLALTLTRGAFIIFLDSDDLVSPTCVEHRAAYMRQHAELDFGIWRCQLFREQAGDVPQHFNADTGADDLDRFLTSDVPWQTTQPIWRRSALDRLTLPMPSQGAIPKIWDESVLSGQDWEFHIRALALGMRYARIDETDCHWRMAGPDRDSIGKQSYGKAHARARPSVVRKMYDLLSERNLLTESRRHAFVALYFQAADNLARRVSRVEGRATWRETLTLGLVDRKRWREVDRYLLLQRWPALAERRRLKIMREWPRAMLPTRGKYFLHAPLPGHVPSVSVVMSAYNSAAYIRPAVESILDQGYRDIEFIIVDDGSTDGTGEILREYADGDCRIRLIQRENRGLTVSLNEGLSLAQGEFIARMDADDVALRDRLDAQVDYMRGHPDVALLGTKVMLIDPCGVELVEGEFHAGHTDIDGALLRGNGAAIYHPSTMIRRSALTRVGGKYVERYNGAEDIELFLRLAEVGRVENLDQVLLQYRKHPQSVNHRRYDEQFHLVNAIIAEARKRRGLPADPEARIAKWTPEPIRTQLQRWAWNALKRRRPDVARTHAWRAVRSAPMNLSNWKLLACAVRGH